MEAEKDDRTHGCDGALSHVELAPDRRPRRPLSLPSAWARTGAARIVPPGQFRYPGRTTGPAPGGSGLAQRLQGPPCTCRDLKVELDVGQAEIVAGHLADALEAVLEGAAVHR